MRYYINKELALKYIEEVEPADKKRFFNLTKVEAHEKEDCVLINLCTNDKDCSQFCFYDDYITSKHSIYPLNINQEEYQNFMFQECGPDYVNWLISNEQQRHEAKLARYYALKNEQNTL